MAIHSSIPAWRIQDRGAWQSTVHSVAHSLTLLKRLSKHALGFQNASFVFFVFLHAMFYLCLFHFVIILSRLSTPSHFMDPNPTCIFDYTASLNNVACFSFDYEMNCLYTSWSAIHCHSLAALGLVYSSTHSDGWYYWFD